MMQITVRLKASWDLMKLTNRYPSVTVFNWCNFNIDFYQIHSASASDLQATTRALASLRRKRGFVLQKKMIFGPNDTVLILRCKHSTHGSVSLIMNRYGCVPLRPFVFHDGWLKVSGICFDEDKLAIMLSRLGKMGELKVQNKTKMDLDMLRENFMIPTSALISNLTEKQAQSLLLAVDHGYYQVPRHARFEDISKTIKIPRTTYEEHVRKAESKVINAVAPYLSIYFGRSKQTH